MIVVAQQTKEKLVSGNLRKRENRGKQCCDVLSIVELLQHFKKLQKVQDKVRWILKKKKRLENNKNRLHR